jgi:hypothetical protein
MTNDRVIAQNSMVLLLHIVHAHHNQTTEDPYRQTPVTGGDKVKRGENEPENHDHEGGIANWED